MVAVPSGNPVRALVPQGGEDVGGPPSASATREDPSVIPAPTNETGGPSTHMASDPACCTGPSATSSNSARHASGSFVTLTAEPGLSRWADADASSPRPGPLGSPDHIRGGTAPVSIGPRDRPRIVGGVGLPARDAIVGRPAPSARRAIPTDPTHCHRSSCRTEGRGCIGRPPVRRSGLPRRPTEGFLNRRPLPCDNVLTLLRGRVRARPPGTNLRELPRPRR